MVPNNISSRRRRISLLAAAITLAASGCALAAQEQMAPVNTTGGESTSATIAPARSPGLWERDTLTGDWGGARNWLKEDGGITLKPRLTQFYQGLTDGDGDHGYKYGSKADLLMNADLGKFGLWKGLSLTVHAEYNFGETVNGRGGTLVPVNTALYLPGMDGADAADLSSVYLTQKFGDSASLVLGKINMVDVAASKPFMGGAGVDSFWNCTFVAPPSGTVPPYLLGALLSVKTEPAAFGLWVYDPNDMANKAGVDEAFSEGVTFRGSVDFPVTIAGRSGHQGFVALYSTKDGTDLDQIHDSYIPDWPQGVPLKNDRHYLAYTFDQYLYQSEENTKEGVGLFGQFGISDGNPTRLYWSAFAGLGGTGLIPGRSRDNWGVGYYYDTLSSDLKSAYATRHSDLKDSLAVQTIVRDEQGFEIFYNVAVTKWLTLGADLQIIEPGLADDTAVFPGLRTVLVF